MSLGLQPVVHNGLSLLFCNFQITISDLFHFIVNTYFYYLY
ncbi:hypothetical protein HMPREF0765_4539 [Sphingobacterium spiritivorum ATCC 33300]|uniref:Uncharacterized protein n=1 Tax=Sphingobacterium spiritivorum ATCC 33300 TaxID=525372 RepID=C2G4N3_SPHSI|nr:hypothetical protein HMPREF0765_4539 [Sphingobacterium spiritivorum ATCC 33300]